MRHFICNQSKIPPPTVGIPFTHLATRPLERPLLAYARRQALRGSKLTIHCEPQLQQGCTSLALTSNLSWKQLAIKARKEFGATNGPLSNNRSRYPTFSTAQRKLAQVAPWKTATNLAMSTLSLPIMTLPPVGMLCKLVSREVLLSTTVTLSLSTCSVIIISPCICYVIFPSYLLSY